jgi:hypothetical protein
MGLKAYITHHIAGRLRLKIPAAKGRPDLLQQIVAGATSASDIKSVECNALTGSVLIQYVDRIPKPCCARFAFGRFKPSCLDPRLPPRRASAEGTP